MALVRTTGTLGRLLTNAKYQLGRLAVAPATSAIKLAKADPNTVPMAPAVSTELWVISPGPEWQRLGEATDASEVILTGQVIFTCWLRNEADQPTLADSFLTDTVLGQDSKLQTVLAKFDDDATDALAGNLCDQAQQGGNDISPLLCPLLVQGVRLRDDQPGWRAFTATFACTFHLTPP